MHHPALIFFLRFQVPEDGDLHIRLQHSSHHHQNFSWWVEIRPDAFLPYPYTDYPPAPLSFPYTHPHGLEAKREKSKGSEGRKEKGPSRGRDVNTCLKQCRGEGEPPPPTSGTESMSCACVETRPRASVGVPAGEWLCCTRSGRLMWPAKPLLAAWPERFFSPEVCRNTRHEEEREGKKKTEKKKRKQQNQVVCSHQCPEREQDKDPLCCLHPHAIRQAANPPPGEIKTGLMTKSIQSN